MTTRQHERTDDETLGRDPESIPDLDYLFPEPALRPDIGAAWTEEPTIRAAVFLPVADASSLVARGTVTVLSGEPGTGKSFLLISECLRAVEAGERVAFLDYEGGVRRYVERLKQLGCPDLNTAGKIDYLTPGKTDFFKLALEVEKRTLVVVDSLAMACELHGLDHYRPEAARPLMILGQKLADNGSAVIFTDHVVKSADNRHGPMGSNSKTHGVDLSLSLLKCPKHEFGIGVSGYARLKCEKSRDGHPVQGDAWRMTVNADPDGSLSISLGADGPEEAGAGNRQLVEDALRDAADGLSVKDIETALSGALKERAIQKHLTALEAEGIAGILRKEGQQVIWGYLA